MTEKPFFLPSGSVSLTIPDGVHMPPASSIELAELLDVHPGEHVLDLGCGCGLFSVAAAMFGAARVLATDIDPAAVRITLANAFRNKVADRVEGHTGSWYKALTKCSDQRFDLIIANPPQTPGRHSFGPKYGGPTGTDHLSTVIEDAPLYLFRNTGRLIVLVISLADAKAVQHKVTKYFENVSIMRTTDRVFTPDEYNSYDDGLFSYLLSLRKQGRSDFQESASGTYVFKNIFIRAASPRQP